MGFNLTKEIWKQELPAGIHLCMINNVQLYKDSKGIPKKMANSMGIIIEFANHENKIHQEVFWVDGFNKAKLYRIIDDAGIAIGSEGIKRKEAIGRRVYIYIKSVRTVNADSGDILYEEKKLFDSAKFVEGLSKPVHKDDPALVNGNLQGDFVSHENAQKGFVEETDETDESDTFVIKSSMQKEYNVSGRAIKKEDDAPTFE